MIVKVLDEPAMPELLDHIGWQLWQAAGNWKVRFDQGMVDAGYPWFREARAKVLSVLDFEGVPQSELTERLGMTKQAVQQLVDQLVADGYVVRRPAPADGRSKIVAYTAKGAKLMTDANRVKQKIAREYRRTLGDRAFDQLESTLKRLNDRSEVVPER